MSLASSILTGAKQASGAVLAGAILDSGKGVIKKIFGGGESAAEAKQRARDEKAAAIAEKRAAADEEKRAKKDVAQRLKDAYQKDKDQWKAQNKAERDAAIAQRRADAAVRLDEKRGLADAQRGINDDARASALQAKQEKALASVAEKSLEKTNDASQKERDAFLKNAQKQWAADDSFLQGQKVVVTAPPAPPAPNPLAAPTAPPPSSLRKNPGETAASFAKRKQKAAEDYAAETVKLVLGGVGSGGKGGLDWLAKHGPQAVEMRQSHNDEIDREIEKRHKSEAEMLKKNDDAKQAEAQRRLDWKNDQITGKKKDGPDPDAAQKKYMTDLGMTKEAQDQFLHAPAELR